jgi:hypothetical protein
VVNESITYNKVSEEGYFWSQVIDGQDTTSTTSSSYPPVSVLSDTQEFTQSILTGVDFTWVIDNSSSMNSKIGKVRDNLSSFIDNIMDDGQALFPFKMHVTAGSRRVNAGLASRIKTDSSSNLTSEAAENNFESFKAKFEDIVLIDELDSNSKEAMYESAKNILVKNSLEYSADRLQVIIILTDDNEQSLSLERGAEAEIEPDAWADYWVSYFKGIGGDEVDKVRVYNIRNPEKDNNNVFTEVEEATNGKKFNILADSYEGILRDISGSVSRLLTSYKLEAGRIIISESVQVTINEAIQATTTYDLIDNSIHFKTIPEAGSAIRVSYSYTLPPAPPVE